MEHYYRIQYPSRGDDGTVLTFSVPDINTALVVAQINLPAGSAELWDGEKQLAVLQRQTGGGSAFWRVT